MQNFNNLLGEIFTLDLRPFASTFLLLENSLITWGEPDNNDGRIGTGNDESPVMAYWTGTTDGAEYQASAFKSGAIGPNFSLPPQLIQRAITDILGLSPAAIQTQTNHLWELYATLCRRFESPISVWNYKRFDYDCGVRIDDFIDDISDDFTIIHPPIEMNKIYLGPNFYLLFSDFLSARYSALSAFFLAVEQATGVKPSQPTEKVTECDNKVIIIEGENKFNGLPIERVLLYFEQLATKQSKNGKPFLTTEQVAIFIRRAFLKQTDLPIQKLIFNFQRGEKTFIKLCFYQFYFLCKGRQSIETTMHCKEKYVLLLTDNFSDFKYEDIFQNFNKGYNSSQNPLENP